MLTYKDLLLTGPEAVCVLDADLEIREHNQLVGLMLGYQDRKLTGRHLSGILYDDLLIRHLLSSDHRSAWFQGECTLRTITNYPLVVKFRAGPLIDEDLSAAHHEITDIIYYPSESRFLPSTPYLLGESSPVAAMYGYILAFRETDEAQHLSYEQKIESLQFLLDALLDRAMEPADVLLEFARIFDGHAEAALISLDPHEYKIGGGDRSFQLPQPAVEAALKAMRDRIVVSYRGESLWYFLPVCSQNEVYYIACIKFAVPRLYSTEHKMIFGLAGRALGIYMDTYTSYSRGKSSESLLETIFNGSDHPIVVVDRKGAISSCNAAAQRIYGRTASEMMGRSFGELAFPADSSIAYEELLNQVMKDVLICEEKMTHVRSDLTMVDVSLTAYPYRLDDGLIVGVIFMMRDLRGERRLWDKMIQWEKLSALGEILSSVANELNNPLTSLMGYSHLLLYRDNDEEIDSMLSTIYEEAKRCGNIVRGILDLARVDDEAQSGYSHVNDIIIATLNLKQRQLRPNNIDVSTNLGESIPGTLADPHDIERLFLRIINYAEQRMLEYDNGGRLTVESSFEDGKIVVRFRDTGTCVLKDGIAEILDPLFTMGEDEGVGLGLSISCEILRNIGGSVRVDNEIGKGNVFAVELPVVAEPLPDMPENVIEITAGTSETGKKVMVVDDEPAIGDLLAEILQQMGHTTDVARDGNEAMQKLDTGHYDLIIADLRMPSGFTGDKLHKFIELKDPELAQRMIFITGDVVNPETRRFLQSTGNLYLEKPFLPVSLQEAIEKSFSKSGTAKKTNGHD